MKTQTYEIKNRYTGAVLFSYELQEGQESGMIARHAAEAAIAGGANLRGANLRGANLYGANLCGAIGDMKFIKSLQIDTWRIAYSSTDLQIGCQRHPISDWKDWKNKPEWISRMDSSATEWANKFLDLVLQIIELTPAEPHANKADEVTA